MSPPKGTIPVSVNVETATVALVMGDYVCEAAVEESGNFHLAIYTAASLAARPPGGDYPAPIRETMLPLHWLPEQIGPGAGSLAREALGDGPETVLLHDATNRDLWAEEEATAARTAGDQLYLAHVMRRAGGHTVITRITLDGAGCDRLRALLR